MNNGFFYKRTTTATSVTTRTFFTIQSISWGLALFDIILGISLDTL